MRVLLFGVVILALMGSLTTVNAQVTLAFQGGENGDNWTYTSTGADATATFEAGQFANLVSGQRSIVVGGNTGGGSCIDGGSGNGTRMDNTFTFDQIDISTSNQSARTLSFFWGNRHPVCNGTGWDSGDDLTFTPVLDGVAQPTITIVQGAGDAAFDIKENQYIYDIPACVNTFSFAISISTNRDDEHLFLDDVTLSAPVLNNIPSVTALASGPLTVCNSETSTYSVAPQNGVGFTWSFPNGTNVIGNNGSESASTISVDWNALPTGTYQISVTPNYSGCGTSMNGSPYTFDVEVSSSSLTQVNAQICENDSYTIGGQTYTTTGNYSILLTSSAGCDSTIELSLTVTPETSVALQETICEGNSYTFNGQNIDQQGTYTAVFQSQSGCDSTITLNLTVLPSYSVQEQYSVCSGDDMTYNGTSYTSPGTYTIAFTTQDGCDSTITLNLIAPDEETVELDVSICDNQSYDFNGTSLTTAGTYPATFTSSSGCDSVVQLNLAVYPTYSLLRPVSLCGNESFEFNGTDYSLPGDYPVPFISSAGCDSVITLRISIDDQIVHYREATICEGETYELENFTFTEAGEFEIFHPNQNGCDSITRLNLIVSPSPKASFSYEIIQTGDEFTTVSFTDNTDYISGFGSNEWDFDDGTILNNVSETEHDLPNETNRVYAVQLIAENNLGCIDSTTALIEITPPLNVYVPNTFTPNSGKYNNTFYFEVNGDIDVYTFSMLVFNRWGEIVFESQNKNRHWDGTYNNTPVPSGTYTWVIQFTRKSNKEELQYKGHVNVLR